MTEITQDMVDRARAATTLNALTPMESAAWLVGSIFAALAIWRGLELIFRLYFSP